MYTALRVASHVDYRFVSLDIWRVERCVYVLSSWLSRPAAALSVFDRCFLFLKSFSAKCPGLPFCSLSSKSPSLLSFVNRII